MSDGRNKALDGIRAISALAVVASHSGVPELPGGFLGVDVFFVLSGFLITSILLRDLDTGGVNVLRFYLRRALRLTPPLITLLLAYIAIAPLLWGDVPFLEHVRDAAFAGLYLSDYTVAFFEAPKYLAHTWSLAVEEQYYLLWPLILPWLLRHWSRSRVVIILMLVYLLAVLWRLLNLGFFLALTPVYFRFDTHLTGLVLGGLVAISGLRIKNGQVADVVAAISAAAVVGGLVFWNLDDPLYGLTGTTPMEFAAAALVLALVSGEGLVRRCLSAAPLAYLGRISYAVYLWHFPVAHYLRERLDPHSTFVIVTAISITLAMVSWHLLEEPLSRFRQKLGPKPSRPDGIEIGAPATVTN